MSEPRWDLLKRQQVSAELDQLIDWVPGRARDRVDQHPLSASQLVEQAGFADVRPADQRYPARAGLRAQPLGPKEVPA